MLALQKCLCYKDNSGYGLIQWDNTFLCNIFSHWPSSYPEWSLCCCGYFWTEVTIHDMYIYICIYIRKSKDYVYGIWVYKALDIWNGYYRVKKSLVSYMKPWTEARNNKYMKYHSKLTYQLSFWNVSRKVDYHAGGKWFIHGPKRCKENQLLSLKHPCWLSLV